MVGLVLSQRSAIDDLIRFAYRLGLISLIAAFHTVGGALVFAGDNSEHVCIFSPPCSGSSPVSFDLVYTGEVFNNARGGITTKNATRYQALLELGIAVDFNETDLPIPGKFFVLGQNTHGRGLTEDFVGDAQVLSNIDSFNNITQVGEYWWEFDLFDETCTVRLGKQDLNTEFLYIDTAADFIQSTFGLSPSTAFPTYPDQSMGVVVLTQLSDRWRLKTGVWDAFAKGSSWGFSGSDSVLAAGELECTYMLGSGSLPGIFAIGAVYESAGTIDGEPVSPVHEYIFQIEQAVFRENRCDRHDRQGLAVFAAYYPRFPGEQIIDASIGDSFVAGCTYIGPIRGRDDDVLGIGVAWTELFGGGTNQETATEIFYKAQLTPRVSLQPDLQYISSPSGIYRDAFVAGVRFQLML